MGILDGLLGGGGSSLDIYGDLFTDAQKEALRSQQLTNTLAKLSQGFAQAAMPSRMPIPFGAALGQAAAAAAGGQDEASERMIKAMQVAEQVRQSRQEREILQKYGLPMAQRIAAGLGVPVSNRTATHA
jgi:hypothetical protein